MNDLKPIKPKLIQENPISLIGDKWMLITAGYFGGEKSYNTMTASWGGIGFVWNMPVAFVFARPQRYTFEFTEKNATLSLSFFEEPYRKALQICGDRSGRDCNKAQEAGLNHITLKSGLVTFNEASLVIECEKLYASNLKKECFLDIRLIEHHYSQNDFHHMYITKITNAWIRE